VFSNVNGVPLDDPRFLPLFETADRLRCPILLHPARGAGFADYVGRAEVEVRDLSRQCRTAVQSAVSEPQITEGTEATV
jgi:predicted TIM-barrel fold metal-dependent hydrolase